MKLWRECVISFSTVWRRKNVQATSEGLIREMKRNDHWSEKQLQTSGTVVYIWEPSGTSNTCERPDSAVKANWFLMKCVLVFRHMHKPDADVSYFEAVLYTSLHPQSLSSWKVYFTLFYGTLGEDYENLIISTLLVADKDTHQLVLCFFFIAFFLFVSKCCQE